MGRYVRANGTPKDIITEDFVFMPIDFKLDGMVKRATKEADYDVLYASIENSADYMFALFFKSAEDHEDFKKRMTWEMLRSPVKQSPPTSYYVDTDANDWNDHYMPGAPNR